MPTHSNDPILVHEIKVPEVSVFYPTQALFLIQQLVRLDKIDFAFRMTSASGKVAFQILEFGPIERPSRIDQTISSIYTDAQIQTRPYAKPRFSKSTRFHNIFPVFHTATHRDGKWYQPAMGVGESTDDPLLSIVHTLGQAAKQDVFVNINIYPYFPFEDQIERDRVERLLLNQESDTTRKTIDTINALGIAGRIIGEVFGERSNTRNVYRPLIQHQQPTTPNAIEQLCLQKVRTSPLTNVLILVEAYSDNAVAVEQTRQALINTWLHRYANVTDYGWGSEDVVERYLNINEVSTQEQLDRLSFPSVVAQLDKNADHTKRLQAVLTPSEIAALFHLPHSKMDPRLVEWISTEKPPQVFIQNPAGIRIGHYKKQPLRMLDTDRNHHINIIGKTGVGKSTFMLNMIRQDIEQGQGVAVIDPHGSLIDQILLTSIPNRRIDDVVVIDLARPEHPPPFNPLLLRKDKDRIDSGLFSDMMDRLYPEFAKAERGRPYLSAALNTLQHIEKPTLRDAILLFEDREFQKGVLHKYGRKFDDGTYAFWQSYLALSSANQREYPNPMLHRVRSLISDDDIQFALCHPDAFDWTDHFRKNHIILIALNAQRGNSTDRDRELIGSVALAFLEKAARETGIKPTRFGIYLDEVHKFTSTPLPELFSEIRKFGIRLIIGHQYLEQLSKEVLSSIIGTVGATFIFQVGRFDAPQLEDYVEPEFDKHKLMNLDNYQAIAHMKFNGQSQPAFDFNTDAAPKASDTDLARAKRRAEMIRQRSITQWMPKPREDIQRYLRARYPRRPFNGGNEPPNEPPRDRGPKGGWGVRD